MGTGSIVLITVVVALVALTVTVVPIVAMLRSEHRHLHGGGAAWTRRHRRRPDSVFEVPRMFNQTSEEEFQEQRLTRSTPAARTGGRDGRGEYTFDSPGCASTDVSGGTWRSSGRHPSGRHDGRHGRRREG